MKLYEYISVIKCPGLTPLKKKKKLGVYPYWKSLHLDLKKSNIQSNITNQFVCFTF